MTLEPASTTNTAATTGKTNTELVSIATTPSAVPKANEPVSPMKNRAGKILNQVYANTAPTIARQKPAMPKLPCANAITPKALNALASKPPARPSRPSAMLTAFAVATTTNTNSGT